MKNLEKDIIRVLKYFRFFHYSPTLSEIHSFLSLKISKKALLSLLEEEVKAKKIAKRPIDSESRYTLGGYSSSLREQKFKVQNSKFKIKKIMPYVRLISRLPQIRLVGVSGTVSMLNAREKDDIDLFIITAKNRLWTGRFLSLILSSLTGRRRRRGEKHTRDRICLNLFFDEKAMLAPREKQNEYVAHEILQMKPLYITGNTYKRYIGANKWVFRLFPNAHEHLEFSIKHIGKKTKILNAKYYMLNAFGNLIEKILKVFQLYLINKHRTTELITDTQLWFHPDDFEKKILK